jgi:hypothetical protein
LGTSPNPQDSRYRRFPLHPRLLSYTTAAAGACVLSLSQSAEAQIVFTPANAVITSQTSYALDLTNHGTVEGTDFILHGSLSAYSATVFSALRIQPGAGNAVEGGVYMHLDAAKALGMGERIGSTDRFVSQGFPRGVLMGRAVRAPGGGYLQGNWVDAIDRYLGLRFQINGETHYGWARMSVKLSVYKPMEVLLTGYAYETQPNTPIAAGEEERRTDAAGYNSQRELESNNERESNRSQAIAQPGQGRLGNLAAGAAGLHVWRQLAPVQAEGLGE